MYGHFIQFTIPKIGQALVAVVLYLNFLKLPFVACFGVLIRRCICCCRCCCWLLCPGSGGTRSAPA